MEFFRKLFEIKSWNPGLIKLDIFCNIIIAVALFTIPISLYSLKSKNSDTIVKSKIYSVFSWFSILCAISRLLYIVICFYPILRFHILINYLCAIGVCVLAYRIRPILQYLIDMPSFSELQDVIKKQADQLAVLTCDQEESEKQIETLNSVIINLQHILQQELWVHDRQTLLNKLGDVLTQLGNSSNETSTDRNGFKP